MGTVVRPSRALQEGGDRRNQHTPSAHTPCRARGLHLKHIFLPSLPPKPDTPRSGCDLLLVTDGEAEACPRAQGWWVAEAGFGPESHGAGHPNISTCLTATFQFLVQWWTSQPPPLTLLSPEHRGMAAERGAGAHRPLPCSTQTGAPGAAGCPNIDCGAAQPAAPLRAGGPRTRAGRALCEAAACLQGAQEPGRPPRFAACCPPGARRRWPVPELPPLHRPAPLGQPSCLHVL